MSEQVFTWALLPERDEPACNCGRAEGALLDPLPRVPGEGSKTPEEITHGLQHVEVADDADEAVALRIDYGDGADVLAQH